MTVATERDIERGAVRDHHTIARGMLVMNQILTRPAAATENVREKTDILAETLDVMIEHGTETEATEATEETEETEETEIEE